MNTALWERTGRRLTLAALADGIMDAAVMIRYELALRAPEKHWEQWRDAQPPLAAWYADVSQRPSMQTVPKV